MTWQTDILHWSAFPWACENIRYDLPITDLIGFGAKGETETAFFCTKSYRILTSECPGMSCPNCKVHGHDEFIARLKGI